MLLRNMSTTWSVQYIKYDILWYLQMERESISFYPLRKAKVLGGAVATETSELIKHIQSAVEKSKNQD